MSQPQDISASLSPTQAATEAKSVSRLRQGLQVGAALTCLALGGLGVLLPVLPTTPFVLLASYLLVRSSPRLHRKLRDSRVFGPFLRDWETHHGVRAAVKLWAVFVVVTFIGATLIFADLPDYVRLILLVLGAIGLTVVLRLPVVRVNAELPTSAGPTSAGSTSTVPAALQQSAATAGSEPAAELRNQKRQADRKPGCHELD